MTAYYMFYRIFAVLPTPNIQMSESHPKSHDDGDDVEVFPSLPTFFLAVMFSSFSWQTWTLETYFFPNESWTSHIKTWLQELVLYAKH